MYLLELAVTGITSGCRYALMAVGLTLVYGLLRILHIAHAAVYTLGAYVTVIVANATGSLIVGFATAVVVAPLAGMATYRLLYEPLLRYRPDVPMVASLGLLVLATDAFRLAFGEQGVTLRQNTLAEINFDFMDFSLNAIQITIIAVTVVVFGGLHVFTTRTRIGIGWRATVSNPRIAATFGIDPIKVRYMTFGIGSALAAIAGGLVALLDNFVDPTTGYVVSYKALAIIVLGGLGSVRGTLIAAIVLGLVEAYGTIFLGKWLNRDAIAFLALIILLMVRPQGFVGRRAA